MRKKFFLRSIKLLKANSLFKKSNNRIKNDSLKVLKMNLCILDISVRHKLAGKQIIQ